MHPEHPHLRDCVWWQMRAVQANHQSAFVVSLADRTVRCWWRMCSHDIADIYIEATNKVLMMLAEHQIKQAFEQSEKEVTDLRQRTKEGIATARMKGKQIGAVKGKKLVTQKSKKAKEIILKYAKTFGGTLSDKEVRKLAEVSKNTYYKYKKELLFMHE